LRPICDNKKEFNSGKGGKRNQKRATDGPS
jgi:hypothetical protein